MNILILADLDDFHWEYGNQNADIIISCGDLYDQVILEAAEKNKCNKIFAVKGNHDFADNFKKPIVDLHLKVVEYEGISFGGFNGSWKYKDKGLFMYSQQEVRELLTSFPPVDIFLAHNSPRGIHDRDDTAHQGFDAFNDYIQRCKNKLFIHGHQHVKLETRVAETKVIGVYGYNIIDLGII